MNEISFRCSSCDKLLRTRDPQMAGKKIRCPACGEANTVPGVPQAHSQAEQAAVPKSGQPSAKVERPTPAKAERPVTAQQGQAAKRRALPDDETPRTRSTNKDRSPLPGRHKEKGRSPVVGIVAVLMAVAFVTLAALTRYAGIFNTPPQVQIVRSTPLSEDRSVAVGTPGKGEKEDPEDDKPEQPGDGKEAPKGVKPEQPGDKKPQGEDVGALIVKVKDADARTRGGAVNALGALGQKALPALPDLIRALADDDVEVRKKAAGAVRALGSQPPSVLIDFSATWCPPCQRMKPITTKLVKEGLPLWEVDTDKHPELSSRFNVEAVPTFVLVENGKETSRDAGQTSEKALRAMMKGLPKSMEGPLPTDLADPAAQARWMALLLSLTDEDAWVQYQGIRALEKQGAKAVPVLTRVIQSKDPDVLRVGAASGLRIALAGQAASPEVAGLVKAILAQPKESADLRGHAAVLAHDHKVADGQVVPALIAAVKGSTQAPLRASAVARLGDLQSAEAIPTLIDALKEEDDGTQNAAIVALGKMGARAGTALPALLALYDKDSDDSTRNRLREACQQIVPSAKEAAPTLVKALKEGSDPVRLLTLELLNFLDDPKAAEATLVPLLKAESQPLRIRAAITLNQLGQNVPAAANVLVEALKDEQENYEATSALHQMGRRAAPLLVGCVTDAKRTQRERMRAARILSGVAREVKSIRPALEKGLMGKDEHVRLASALVLARMTPLNDAVLAPLVAGLKDADRQTQQECAQALANAKHKAAGKALLAALEELDQQGEDGEERRREVASALSSIEELPESELAGVLALLEKPNSRAAAAMVLANAGNISPKAVPALLKAFAQVNDNERQEVGGALVGLGKPAVAGLLKLVEDTKVQEPVRLEALRVLGRMGENAHDARPTLAKFLKDPNKQVKARAAITLAYLQSDENLVPLLLEALEDKQVGYEVQSALGALGPRAATAVDQLCEMLKGSDQNKRSVAIRILPEVGRDSEKASTAMLALLKNQEDANVRQTASYSLGRFGDKVVPALAKAVSDPSMSCLDVIRTLEQMGPTAKAASPALTERLLDKDRKIAAQAAVALARVDPKQQAAVPVLLEALRSKDQAVRDPALRALSAFGPEARSAVPVLVQALQSAETRGSALAVLARIGPDAAKAVDPITQQLSSREKAAAAFALAAIGPQAAPAVPRLIAMLDDEQNWYAAAGALSKIGGPAKQVVPVLVKKLADEDSRLRACQVLGSVGKLDPDQALPPLLKLTSDADVDVRRQAIQSLGMLQSAKAVPPLLEALKDKDVTVRLQAAGALGQLGPKAAEAGPALQGLLQEKDPTLRRAAAGALGSLGDAAEPAVPALIKSLNDKDVRDTAAYSLGRIGAKAEGAIPHLVKLLDDPNARYSAMRALGQFGPKAKETLPKLRALLKETKGPMGHEIGRIIQEIEGKKQKPEPEPLD